MDILRAYFNSSPNKLILFYEYYPTYFGIDCHKVKATANLGPAAKDGNLAAVDDCLEKGADVDVRAAVSKAIRERDRESEISRG